MASLGHRLKLLRAVWEVKKDQGIQVDEDEWKPAGTLCPKPCTVLGVKADHADVPAEGRHVAQGEIDRLWDVINEQREWSDLRRGPKLNHWQRSAYSTSSVTTSAY